MSSSVASLSILLVFVAPLCSPAQGQAFSSEPGNFRVIHTGNPEETRIAVKVPYFSNMSTLYPNLELKGDHEEASPEHNSPPKVSEEAILTTESGLDNSEEKNSTSIVEKRSARAYPMGVPYHRFRRRYYDSSPSSSTWGGKWLNQLKRRTSMIMNPMASAYDRRQQMMIAEDGGSADEPEMSATYHGGGGYGHGGGGYGKGGVNKSAVGLLGFLSLLSLIQNVLNQTQPMGRRRREVDTSRGPNSSNQQNDYYSDEVGFDWEEDGADMNKIVPLLLPVMNAVTAAQNGNVKVECTFGPICLANQVLIQKLGERGRVVGEVISDIFSKILKRASWRWRNPDVTTTGRIIRAGMSGRAGKDCTGLYKRCHGLSTVQQYSSDVVLRLLEAQEDDNY